MAINEYIEEVDYLTGPPYGTLRSGDDFVLRVKLGWRVRTTHPHIDSLMVRFFAGLPREGASYVSYNGVAYDPFLLVREVNVERFGDNPHEWLYTADYSNELRRPDQQADTHNPTQPTPGAPTPSTNPELRLPTLSWAGRYERRPFETDHGGRPVLNSAGERFSPMPEQEFRIQTVTFERFERTYDQEFAAKFSKPTLNANSIRLLKFGLPEEEAQLVPSGCAKITAYDGQTYVPAGSVLVAKVVYKMEIGEEVETPAGKVGPWSLRLWDVGKNEIGPNGKLRPIYRNGVAVTEDVPLDGQGRALVPPDDLPPLSGSGPHPVREWIKDNMKQLPFTRHPSEEFQLLKLDGLIVPEPTGP